MFKLTGFLCVCGIIIVQPTAAQSEACPCLVQVMEAFFFFFNSACFFSLTIVLIAASCGFN